MNSVGFAIARWDHWLLVVCFVAIATTGLWVTWQWHQESRKIQAHNRAKAKLARRLALEIHPSYQSDARPYSVAKDQSVEQARKRFNMQSRQR